MMAGRRVLFSLLLLCFTNAIALAQNDDMDFSSPEATLKTYLKACEELDFKKSDLCYTEEFQNFTKTDKRYLAHRHPGQLRNEYNTLHNKPFKLERYGNKAIMRFGPIFESPAPLYFIKERGEWKIDAMFSFKNIIYSDNQSWYWRNPKVDNEKEWLRN